MSEEIIIIEGSNMNVGLMKNSVCVERASTKERIFFSCGGTLENCLIYALIGAANKTDYIVQIEARKRIIRVMKHTADGPRAIADIYPAVILLNKHQGNDTRDKTTGRTLHVRKSGGNKTDSENCRS